MFSEPLHLLFAGTPDIAVPTLKTLAQNNRFIIDLVITQPDRPVGRKKEITPPPVKVEAQRLQLPVFQPESLNKEWHTFHQSHPEIPRPDVLIVIAYGQLLSQEMLDFPKIAPLNVHFSLLPLYRGASPIQHAILNGDAASGVTIQKMIKELDAGPIAAQESLILDPRETTTSLFERCALLSAELLPKTLLTPLTLNDQDETKATICTKLTRADGAIDPKVMTAEEIDRRVRALNPWPGVTWNDTKILETNLAPAPDAFNLACQNDTHLFITTIQPAGGKPMSGAAFARGRLGTSSDILKP